MLAIVTVVILAFTFLTITGKSSNSSIIYILWLGIQRELILLFHKAAASSWSIYMKWFDTQPSSSNPDVPLKNHKGWVEATVGLMEGSRMLNSCYSPVLSYIKILHFNGSIKRSCWAEVQLKDSSTLSLQFEGEYIHWIFSESLPIPLPLYVFMKHTLKQTVFLMAPCPSILLPKADTIIWLNWILFYLLDCWEECGEREISLWE